MKIPKVVKILGWDIKVKYVKGLVYEGHDCFGLWSESESAIYLVKGMPIARRREIFLHECIHAIVDISRMTLRHGMIATLSLSLGDILSQMESKPRKKVK